MGGIANDAARRSARCAIQSSISDLIRPTRFSPISTRLENFRSPMRFDSPIWKVRRPWACPMRALPSADATAQHWLGLAVPRTPVELDRDILLQWIGGVFVPCPFFSFGQPVLKFFLGELSTLAAHRFQRQELLPWMHAWLLEVDLQTVILLRKPDTYRSVIDLTVSWGLLWTHLDLLTYLSLEVTGRLN